MNITTDNDIRSDSCCCLSSGQFYENNNTDNDNLTFGTSYVIKTKIKIAYQFVTTTNIYYNAPKINLR